MSDEIKERFRISRQLDFGRGWQDNVAYGEHKGVPGRVMEIVTSELSLHLPEIERSHIEEIAKCVVGRLYRPERFDFDRSMALDEQWQRGMYKR